MLGSPPASVKSPPPPSIGGRIRALHRATIERGRLAGERKEAETPDALAVAGGASFRLFDQMSEDIAIDVHGHAEERVRAAISESLKTTEADRREAAQRERVAVPLDSRGATFHLTPSTPCGARGSEESDPVESAPLLSTTKGRYDLRHGVASILRPDDGGRGPSVCGCGISGYNVDAVRIHQSERGKASVSGVFRCDSAVLCPVCATSRAMAIEERLTAAVQACVEAGGSVWFVTPTVRRKLDQDLAKLRAGFQAAYREARQGKGWAEAAEAGGFLGITNVVESPWSPLTGWGLHGHSLLFFASPFQKSKAERLREVWERAVEWSREEQKKRVPKPPTYNADGTLTLASRLQSWEDGPEAIYGIYLDQQWEDEYEATVEAQRPVCDLLISRFLARLPKRDLSGTIDAQGVEMVRSAKGASRYLGKLASELAHGWVKEGRKERSTSVHPFALAARGSMRGADGEPMAIPGLESVPRQRARSLWQEYAGAMKGIRLGVITARLAEKLGIVPDADEEKEGTQEFLQEGHIGDVPARMWNFLLRKALAGTFLTRVEAEIDPTDGDDYRRASFEEIRADFLQDWLDSGDGEAKLFARVWQCAEVEAEEDPDSDASFLADDSIPADRLARDRRRRWQRRDLAANLKRLRAHDRGGVARPHILASIRDARLEAIGKFRRQDSLYRMMLNNAVARIHANDGHGTPDRIRRVIAELHAAAPGVRRLEEMDVIRACQRERRRFEEAQAQPSRVGDIVDDIAATF